MKNKIFYKHKNSNQIADDVMKNGILLGCHQGMKNKEVDYICKTFKKFISSANN